MSRIAPRIAALALALFALFTGAASAQSAPGIYPLGLTSESARSGIYPGTDAGNCCWMGTTATLRLAPPRTADTLLLNVYLPPFASQPGGEALRVRINDAPEVVACCLDPGEHELSFRLPARAAPFVDVRITAEKTFVPKARGLNDDPRTLSILVRGVAFLDARSGERFDPAPKPWLPARAAFALLALFGVAIFALTLRRPIYGVAALVLTDPFLLAAYVHATTLTLPKVALVATAAALLPRLLRERPRLSPPLIALVVAQGLVILSLAASLPHAALAAPAWRELLKGAQYLATLLVAYAAYALDPDERAARIALLLVAFAVLLPALAQERIGTAQSEIVGGHVVSRIAGPLEGPNQLAGFLGIVIPVIAAFAFRPSGWLFERIAVLLGIVACALTFSRGGFAALLVALALLAVTLFRPQRVRLAGIVVGALFTITALLAFAVFAGVEPALALFASHGDRFNGGLGSRTDLWKAAFAMWRAHPLFGIGPGNFEIAVGRYDPGIRTHANGMFFQTLAEQGVLGLLTYLGLVVTSIAAFAKRIDRPLALGACTASVALAFHQIVDCMTIYPKVGVIWWVVLGVAAASSALVRRRCDLV